VSSLPWSWARNVSCISSVEIISINPLFSGIVAANVFLLGFLLSGTLADYKESERLPGELSASLENLRRRRAASGWPRPRPTSALPGPDRAREPGHSRVVSQEGPHGRASRAADELTPQFATMEKWTQATLLARLKQEQSNLRRSLVRIHTIRETSFVASGYLLVDVVTTWCASA